MAWNISTAKRRALVKLQLRDKNGRWIEMGGGVKWYSSKRKKVIAGTVVGSQGNNALVRLNKENPTHEPELVKVPARNIEVVDSKASLKPKEGAPSNETPEFEEPEAVGERPEASVSKATPYVKQSDTPEDYDISETSDGRTYISRKDKGELYFPARQLDIGDELISPEGADPTKPFSIGKAWPRKGAESVNTTGPKLGKVIDINGDRYAVVRLADGVTIDDPKRPGEQTDLVTVGLSNSVIKATPGLKAALGDKLSDNNFSDQEEADEQIVDDTELDLSDHEGREVPEDETDTVSEEEESAPVEDEDAPVVDDEQVAAEEAERRARDEDLARRVAERQAKLDEMGDQYDEEGLTAEEQNMITAYERMAKRAADNFEDDRAAGFFAKAEELRDRGKKRLDDAGVEPEKDPEEEETAPESAPEPEEAPESAPEADSPTEAPTADIEEVPADAPGDEEEEDDAHPGEGKATLFSRSVRGNLKDELAYFDEVAYSSGVDQGYRMNGNKFEVYDLKRAVSAIDNAIDIWEDKHAEAYGSAEKRTARATLDGLNKLRTDVVASREPEPESESESESDAPAPKLIEPEAPEEPADTVSDEPVVEETEETPVISRRMGYNSAVSRILDAQKVVEDSGVDVGSNNYVEVTDIDQAQDFLRDVVADIDIQMENARKVGKIGLNRDRREIASLLKMVNDAQFQRDGKHRPHKALREQEERAAEPQPEEAPEAPETPTPAPVEEPEEVEEAPEPSPEPEAAPEPEPEVEEPVSEPTVEAEPVVEAEEVHPLDALGIERRTPTAIEGEKYPPTQQQQDVIDAVLGGLDTKVQAMAGTGKTSTLEALSRRLEQQGTKAVYIAFNKTVQTEAEERMPKNVEARTGHSLAHAWAAKNMPFIGVRLEGKDPSRPIVFGKGGKPTNWAKKSAKTSANDIARELGFEKGDLKDAEGQEVSKGQAMLAVKKTVGSFMLSDSDTVTTAHVPDTDEMNFDEDSKQKLAEFATAYWNDLSREDGVFRVTHDAYRKHWALSRPDLTDGNGGNKAGATVLYIDEAQDTPPVLAKVVADQKMQKVIVGDQNQAIYAFAENIDYLSEAQGDIELPLNKSWRFGPEVADIGNRFLQLLNSKGRVEGGGEPSSIVRGMEDADAVLVRTNAGMLGAILEEAERGRRISAPDGTRQDLSRLANTVQALMDGYVPDNPHDDLIGYKDWGEVREAADSGDRSLGKLISMFDKKKYGEDDDPVNIRDFMMKRARKAIDSLVIEVPSFGNVKTVQEGDRTYLDAADHLPADQRKWAVKNFSQDLGEKRAPWAGKSDMTWAEKKKAYHEEAGLEKDGWKMDRKTWRYYTEDPEVVAKFATYEGASDVTVSTAHKSKGLEWDRVRMGDDFFVPREDPKTGQLVWPDDVDAEHKLAYVAVTRARKELDPGVLDYVFEHTDPNGGDPNATKGAPEPEATPESDTDPTPEQAEDETPVDVTPDTEESLDETVEEAPETLAEPVAETSPYNDSGLTETEQRRADELGQQISEVYRGMRDADLDELENEWNDILEHGEKRLAGEDLPEYQKPEPLVEETPEVDEPSAPVVESPEVVEPEPTPVLQEPEPKLVPEFDDEGLSPQERRRANELERWINDVYRGRGSGNVTEMENELFDLLQKGAKRLKGDEKPAPRETPEPAPKGRKPRQSYDGVAVLDSNGRQIQIGDTIGHPRLGPVQVTGFLPSSGRVLFIDPKTGKEASVKAGNINVMDASTDTPEIPAGEPGTRFTDPATGKKGFYNADGTPILKDDRVRNAEGRTGTVVGVYAKDGKAWVPVQWDDTGATTRVMGNLLWPENESDSRSTGGDSGDAAPEPTPEAPTAPETIQEPEAAPETPEAPTPATDEDLQRFIEEGQREQRVERLSEEATSLPVGTIVRTGETVFTKREGSDGYQYWDSVTVGEGSVTRATYTNYDFANAFVRVYGGTELNPEIPTSALPEPDGFHEGLAEGTFMPSAPGSDSGLRKVGDDRWEMIDGGQGLGKFAGDAFAKMLFDATSPELIKPEAPKPVTLRDTVADYSGAEPSVFAGYDPETSAQSPDSQKGIAKFDAGSTFLGEGRKEKLSRSAYDPFGNEIKHGSKVWNARTHEYEGVVAWVDEFPDGRTVVKIINPNRQLDAYGRLNYVSRFADKVTTFSAQDWETSTDLDFSDATSVAEINGKLKSAYPSVHFKISDDMDLSISKKYAEVVSKMFNKYPMLQHQMNVVNTERDTDGSLAYVRSANPENAVYFDLSMSLNEVRSELGFMLPQTYTTMVRDVRKGSDAGWFNNVPEGREVEYVVTHEFGHALDSLTGWADRDDHKSEIYQLMEEFFKGNEPDGSYRLAKELLSRKELSQYSLTWAEGIDYKELMAESFADVEINGVNAKPLSKLIHQYLLNNLKGLI